MSTRAITGLGIVGMAVLLGVLGDSLLRATPWGVNLPIWIAVGAAGGWAVIPNRPPRAEGGGSGGGGAPVWVALFFASCLAWRDSSFLAFWNTVAVLAAGSLVALQSRGLRLRSGRIYEFVLGAATSGAHAVGGALLLTPDDLGRQHLSRHTRRAAAIATGTLLAVPVLLVFGALLRSADPVFDSFVQSTFNLDYSTVSSHLLFAGFLTWCSAGLLRLVVRKNDPFLAAATGWIEQAKHKPSLGAIELAIPLGTLALIFVVFVGLQARYLFGGEDVILATVGLTYAEYARGGFFELVAVATLLLPVLLVFDWLVPHDSVRARMAFRGLASGLLVLIIPITVSALFRMYMYVTAYGLTEDRFYAAAFMGWIGAVMACFAFTVLRGFRHRFAFGAIASGFGLLALLNAVSPDAVIARVNLSRIDAGKGFDVAYVERLSADAAPALMARLTSLESEAQCVAWRLVSERAERGVEGGWRTWNLSRSVARRMLRAGPRGCQSSE